MKLNQKQLKILKWITKITSLAVILFGLPFYLGYGNPLPFINPEYTLWDNTWLTTFPLVFIGLALGWKYEKIGGYLITIPILTASILGLITETDFAPPMIVPFVLGIMYLILGHNK